MLIAQISDLHICPKGDLAYGVSETNLFAERAIHALMRLNSMPDCVILTGDLAENGYEEEYAIASELLGRLPCPVYVIPGNHDRREPMRQAFKSGGYLPQTGPLNYSIACGGLQLIALDSLEEGSGIGVLTDETLDFLSSALSQAKDRPTLVMLHHPPFMTGIGHMDVVRLVDGAQRLESIISAHPQVQRVLCGHVHRSIQQIFAVTLCQVAPSVAHQVTLDLRPEAPSCFVLEPPAYLLHIFQGGRIVTHTAQVDRAAGPFSFNLPESYTSRAVVYGSSGR